MLDNPLGEEISPNILVQLEAVFLSPIKLFSSGRKHGRSISVQFDTKGLVSLALLEGLDLQFLEGNSLGSTVRMHKDKPCQEARAGEVVFPY